MNEDSRRNNDDLFSSTGPHRLKMDDWISCAPFERLLNMTIVKAEQGQAILTMPFLKDYAQGAGLMHGGALVSLADTAMVMAIKSIVKPRTHFVTTSMQSQFLRPVQKGIVTARARIIDHKGDTVNGRATVTDEKDRPVLDFRSTFKIPDRIRTR